MDGSSLVIPQKTEGRHAQCPSGGYGIRPYRMGVGKVGRVGRTMVAPTGWMEVVLLSPRKQKAGTPNARADMESTPTGWFWGERDRPGEHSSRLRGKKKRATNGRPYGMDGSSFVIPQKQKAGTASARADMESAPTGWMEVVLLSSRKQKAGTPSARADMESAPTGWIGEKRGKPTGETRDIRRGDS